MSDLSFFREANAISLAALVAAVAAPMPTDAEPDRAFHAIAALDQAGPGDIVAFVDDDDRDDLRNTRAGACLVAAQHLNLVPSCTIALVSERPLEALASVAMVLQPRGLAPGPVFERGGIDPAAAVHGEAHLEQGVVVDPGVVIGPRAEIGAATIIGANSVIGAGVRIGRGCTIDAQVSIRYALIGDRVTIHAGARIGLAGHAKDLGALSLGRVIIQDGAIIGPNTVVERGHRRDTMIGDGASIATLAIVRADTIVARSETLAARAFPPSPEMV